MHAPSGSTATPDDGRPTQVLPLRQLFQLSVYWFGINAIWGGIDGVILQERVPDLVAADFGGRALAIAKVSAVIIAILVQPTIGAISDYTISRWGRRKPYIAIGATLDVVFLIGIAFSQTYLSVIAFLILLQFSSNFAQGPFQGFIPDLVPAKQVGLASALVGVMSVLGVIGGQALASTGYLLGTEGQPDFTIPTIAIGLIELATALGTLKWVQEGRAPRDRAGRSWVQIAGEAWGTDILRERSFVWLVASRLLFLMGVGTIYNLNVLYLDRSLGLTDAEKGFWVPLTSVVIGLAILVSTIPAARLSERIGRKRVIYGSCALGGLGMALLTVAPGVLVAEVGILLVAVGAGAFLAVDWALMTDIIPKAASGRYMGMSNVATASSGALALVVGGTILDTVAAGPRAAMAVGIGFYLLAALLLRPVDERRREDEPAPSPQAGPEGGLASSSA
jgi:MFS-type transporter involved in bile tolerance (Atg22 family)